MPWLGYPIPSMIGLEMGDGTFNQVLKRVIRSMKIGFICPTVPGHLNPMTALARHLQVRNDEVVFLYSSERQWFAVCPWGQGRRPKRK
jgi:hypothetical protein